MWASLVSVGWRAGGVARATPLATPLQARARTQARTLTLATFPKAQLVAVRTITSNTPRKAQLPYTRKPRQAPLAHSLAELAFKAGMIVAIMTIGFIALYFVLKRRLSLCSDFRYEMATGLFPGSPRVLAFYYWHEGLEEQAGEDRARWRMQGYTEIP